MNIVFHERKITLSYINTFLLFNDRPRRDFFLQVVFLPERSGICHSKCASLSVCNVCIVAKRCVLAVYRSRILGMDWYQIEWF